MWHKVLTAKSIEELGIFAADIKNLQNFMISWRTPNDIIHLCSFTNINEVPKAELLLTANYDIWQKEIK